MPRYSANISMLFADRPFEERFAAARAAGFEAVECWFPYDLPVAELRAILDGEGLVLNGINTAPGNEAAGEWGLASLPGREAEFRASLDQAFAYALELGRPKVHVLAGNPPRGEEAAGRGAYLANLARAAEAAKAAGLDLLIEPLNPRDRPTYALHTSDDAAAIIARIGPERLAMLFDLYHVQVAEGDILTRLSRHFAVIGHVQVAAVPSRAEPDEGELNTGAILAALDRLGYAGWVGCEYKPRGRTEEGLGWREAFAARGAALA